MSSKGLEWAACPCGAKRAFVGRGTAEKALGRVQAKRTRRADAGGTRRGLKVEHRAYECDFGAWHLTAKNRKDTEARPVGA